MWHIDLPHFAHFFAPFSEQLFMFDICTSLAHRERIKNLCLNFFHKLHLSPHHNNFWLVFLSHHSIFRTHAEPTKTTTEQTSKFELHSDLVVERRGPGFWYCDSTPSNYQIMIIANPMRLCNKQQFVNVENLR